MKERIFIPVSTGTFAAEFYFEQGRKLPGIIFLHDITGIQESTRETARHLFREGYQVLIPDLFSKDGAWNYCVRMLFDKVCRDNEENNPAMMEIHELIEKFKAFEEVDSENIGLIGQCLSGGFVLQAAMRPDLKAPVVFHHSFGFSGSGMPKTCVPKVQHKIQGHFSNFDFITPKERVAELKTDLGEKLEDHYYDLPHGIPHFFELTSEGKRAYSNMLQFFRTNLVSAKKDSDES